MDKSLKELILENPDLPLVVKVWDDDCDSDEYTESIFTNCFAEKGKVYIYRSEKNDYNTYLSDDIDYVEDYFREVLEHKEEYVTLSDEGFTQAVLKYIKENVKSYDAIIITAR